MALGPLVDRYRNGFLLASALLLGACSQAADPGTEELPQAAVTVAAETTVQFTIPTGSDSIHVHLERGGDGLWINATFEVELTEQSSGTEVVYEFEANSIPADGTNSVFLQDQTRLLYELVPTQPWGELLASPDPHLNLVSVRHSGAVEEESLLGRNLPRSG